jgi:hypothetical protein
MFLRIPRQPARLHQLCYPQTDPPRRPHGGDLPSADDVRPCFRGDLARVKQASTGSHSYSSSSRCSDEEDNLTLRGFQRGLDSVTAVVKVPSLVLAN